MSICALYDYIRCENEVQLLEETFDASIELHDPVTWMSVESDNTSGDSLVIKTINSINETEKLFKRLRDREEKVCKALLTKILQMESEVRVYVLGENFEEPVSNIKEYINQVFNNLQVPLVKGDSEETYMSFIENIAM